MKKYYNIGIEVNHDANSYNRMTANVKMLDNAFDEYQLNQGYGWLKLWGEERLVPYYDGIPLPLKGKLMTSPKKKIDYWEKRGLSVSCLYAIVSQKFMDVINGIGVNPDEYIVKPIEMINSPEKFYMFFVPAYSRDCLLVEKSLFIRPNDPYDIRKIENASKLADTNNEDLEVCHAVLGAHFIDKDIIGIDGIPNYFVSERVLKALIDNCIKGFIVRKRYKAVVLESPDEDSMSSPAHYDFNPLSEAVIDNDKETFDLLVSKGMDVDALDCNGLTPLFYASMYGRVEMADTLISAGADIEHRDKKGNTPLSIACQRFLINGADIINFLLSKGADPYAEDICHSTPIGFAMALGFLSKTDFVKYEKKD